MNIGTIYNTLKSRWQHGKPIYESGIAIRWLLGPCPNCGSVTSTYGGGFSCHNDSCRNSRFVFPVSSEPMPDWWNTGIQVYLDGDAWCAVKKEFINLQESPVGFGSTPDAAVMDLRSNDGY